MSVEYRASRRAEKEATSSSNNQRRKRVENRGNLE